jgi:D-glycero-alpha-D-manno-heptose-7-phosphate kinase
MTPRLVEAAAPTRIDLAGGTLDLWPLSVLVPGAITVNLAVELRARARVERRDDRKVRIVSEDRRRQATLRLPVRFEDAAACSLPLPARLVAAFGPQEGLNLTLRAEAPAGAGLGGSSALGIAAGAALNRWSGEGLSREGLLRRVMNLEAMELGVPTGNQDYLAALQGGLSVWHHGIDGTVREPLPIPAGLEARLVLAYTGEPRGSGFSNWQMFRRFVEGERTTVGRMHEIARIARELRHALRQGELDAAGRLLGEEGRLRYRLAPSVATPALRRADAAARGAGALGAKVCGAGGGGCLVAFARAGRAARVAKALADAGAKVLPLKIARAGLRVSGP